MKGWNNSNFNYYCHYHFTHLLIPAYASEMRLLLCGRLFSWKIEYQAFGWQCLGLWWATSPEVQVSDGWITTLSLTKNRSTHSSLWCLILHSLSSSVVADITSSWKKDKKSELFSCRQITWNAKLYTPYNPIGWLRRQLRRHSTSSIVKKL